MRTIVVIACGAKKLDEPAAACDLYTGGLFRAHREIAELKWGGVDFIMSAKHGLIGASDVLDPYDASLKDLTRKERTEWAADVAVDLLAATAPGDKIVVLAGKAYEEWIPILQSHDRVVIRPLAGMGVGERRRYARELREGRRR